MQLTVHFHIKYDNAPMTRTLQKKINPKPNKAQIQSPIIPDQTARKKYNTVSSRVHVQQTSSLMTNQLVKMNCYQSRPLLFSLQSLSGR
jgi:hypothetical protein